MKVAISLKSFICLFILSFILFGCQFTAAPPKQIIPFCEFHEGDVLCGESECELTSKNEAYCGEQICDKKEEKDCQEKPSKTGTTTPREPDTANPDEPFKTEVQGCKVALLAKIGIKKHKKKKITLTHNLKHGLSEVVIPKGYDGKFVVYEPVTAETGPYDGTFTSTWTADGNAQTAIAGKNENNLVKNFIKARAGWWGVNGTPPEIQDHSISASWKPDTGDPCSIKHDFKVVFAGDTPVIPRLRLGDFYKANKKDGFASPTGSTSGTRVFREDPPVARSRPASVHVPIGIFWDIGTDCCGIDPFEPKIIQFARAAIDGPNGRLGKPWTLDILDKEAKKKGQKHDPTYTGRPGSDANETPKTNGSGGTRRETGGLTQWDAPGMPNSLYHRLFHAEEPSNYRQQFFSLLVCRPKNGAGKHKAPFYLEKAKVKQYAITTITWNFPGQKGVDRTDMTKLRPPVIKVGFHTQDAGCKLLKDVLDKNQLLDAFNNPEVKRRNLKILPEKKYKTLLDDVKAWTDSPKDKLQIP